MVKTDRLAAGEVGYIITGIKDVAKLRVGDTLTTEAGRPPSRCPATARRGRSCSAASIRSTPTATRTCATRSTSWRSTTPRSRTSRRPHRRSASAFAAASSGCCTWTSCASGSSASTGSSCWRRRRTSSTTCGCAATRRSRSTARPTCPTRTAIEAVEEPYIRATIITPPDFVGPIMELCQDRRGIARRHALPVRAAGAAALRPAARRDRARLLRPAEVAQPRLRVARLRDPRLPRVRTW